jgi:hypothetical protein
VEIVKALPGVVNLRVTPEHISFLIHEAGRVELAAYVHAYHQSMIPNYLQFFHLSGILLLMHGGYSSC